MTNPLFIRKDYPTIMSGWVTRYTINSSRYDGEINASRDGWSIQGNWPIMDSHAVVEFGRTIRKAHLIYRGLNGRGGEKAGPLPEETLEKLLSTLETANPAAQARRVGTAGAT